MDVKSRIVSVSNSKFNGSETEKRPEKFIGGPVGWKKAGPKRDPSPSFFPPPPHPPFLGLFSALIRNGIAAKKGKEGKKWSNAYTEEEPRLIAFDHFFEFGIAVYPYGFA
jgi:hypothetical protein